MDTYGHWNWRILAVIVIVGLAGGWLSGCAKWHTDNQVAVGEWKIEIQTPPCDSVYNVQFIYPKESGSPITIECDLMPVPTK
jgi:hypothetical protein